MKRSVFIGSAHVQTAASCPTVAVKVATNVDVTFVKGPNGLATDFESHPGKADPRAAVRVEQADDIRFENCRFTRTAEAAALYAVPFAQYDATGVSGLSR